MTSPLVSDPEPILLIGGGVIGKGDIEAAMAHAPRCVAVDGGLDNALIAGLEPIAVIGDFDSVSDAALAQIPRDRQHRISEQNSTDFDKALRSIEAPLFLGVGFDGGRVDHQLAVMHGLVRQPARPCVLLGAREVIFLAPRSIQLELKAGDTVSLFPLASVQGRSTGLEWPIEGLDFHPARYVGTSNRALGPVELQMDAPAMLVIVPRQRLGAVVRSLLSPQAARWSVP